MFRYLLRYFGIVALILAAAACEMKNKTKEVAQIIYAVDSGPILPELQMHEEYTITRTGVELTRSGKSTDTEVFEGEWAFTADEGLLTELFSIAENRECSAYKRVAPQEPPDGGETIAVKILFTDETECTLTYDPGTTYEGAEELLSKVREVLENFKARPNSVPE